jgi:glycosyltransferase involved in cell wall biosynthesis
MIPRPNASLVDRLVDHGSFAVTATLAAPIIRAHDVFVVESPPLFLAATAAVLRGLTGRRYVLHVADPWPDFPIAAGALRGRVPIAMAVGLEELAYRRASLITTVTPPLVARLSAKRGAAGKVRLLSNGVDVERFQPGRSREETRALLGWDLAPTFVYSGTIGVAQGLGTLLDAASTLLDLDMRIMVVGDGLEARELANRARDLRLSNVRFLPAMAATAVPTLLATADAILVLLRRGPLYEESLPTKLVEGLAAGRPVVVSADGYAAGLVRDSSAGIAARAEDPQDLAKAMRRIVEMSRDERRRMGEAGRQLAESAFDRANIVDSLAAMLDETIAGRGASSTRTMKAGSLRGLEEEP